MKRSICIGFSVALMTSAMVLSGCGNNATDTVETPSGDVQGNAPAGGMKIAYVEVDSLMSQYKFCQEYTSVLQKKSNNARNTINQKGKQLQAAIENFQQKLQNNGFTSREQAESVQATLQRQDQDLQELQNRLALELDEETNKYNNALRDSLQNFLREYNKTKKYDLILSKAGDNLLWAEKRYDITTDVVNGLNKRYKSTLNTDSNK